MKGTVAACTCDARNAWELLNRSAPLARKLECPLVLMVILEEGKNQSVALEYAYQCARQFDAQLLAFSGGKALGRMFAQAHRQNVCCITTLNDPALLRRMRLAFGFAQALDVSACDGTALAYAT